MVNFDNDKVETVRQAAKREQVEELLGTKKRSTYYLVVTPTDPSAFQAALDNSDFYAEEDGGVFYFPNDVETMDALEKDLFRDLIEPNDLSIRETSVEEHSEGLYSSKKTAAITKQPFDLRPSSWNVDTNGEGMFLMQAQESRWEEENQSEQKQSGLVFRAAKKTAVGKEDVVPLFNNFYSSWVKLKSALADLTGGFDESGSFQAPGVREINVKMTDLIDQIDALIEESSKK